MARLSECRSDRLRRSSLFPGTSDKLLSLSRDAESAAIGLNGPDRESSPADTPAQAFPRPRQLTVVFRESRQTYGLMARRFLDGAISQPECTVARRASSRAGRTEARGPILATSCRLGQEYLYPKLCSSEIHKEKLSLIRFTQPASIRWTASQRRRPPLSCGYARPPAPCAVPTSMMPMRSVRRLNQSLVAVAVAMSCFPAISIV